MVEIAIAAVFGLLIGSFLNVCIHRLPRNRSVVRPRSHCVRCRRTIAWYDNVPVVSFIVLGGKCRYCGKPISWRYPLVEALTAALFAASAAIFGPTLDAVKYCVFSALMVALAFSDLEKRILPDELTLGGLAAGLVFSAFVPVYTFYGLEPGTRVHWIASAVIGAAVPAGILWFSGWVFEKFRHKEGLGFGDVKLMAMTGAFLGLYGSILTMLVGSVIGSMAGLAFIVITKKDWSEYRLPFGTFLGLAGIVVAYAGRPLTDWYGRLG